MSMQVTTPKTGSRPLIYGEVLYDIFPDGHAVLGGAPFNVAWHLQGFGLAPLFISRVGEDEFGDAVIATMNTWGMDTSGVQRDETHPTGRVQVDIVENEPDYLIVPEQAYDYIEAAPAQALFSQTCDAVLYHGSLAARHPRARATLASLHAFRLPCFLDVNLRAPWWRRDWLDRALQQVRWLKLNEHELAVLLQRRVDDERDLFEGAEQLRRRYDNELVIVTRGERGALLMSATERHAAVPPPVRDFVDSVGAGDAFSAVTLIGVLHAWPLSYIAERATLFAAAVCAQHGATARNSALYQTHLREWTA